MTTVHKVKSARKQRKCAKCGRTIRKGEAYLWWANRLGGGSRRQDWCKKHGEPRQSDLTMSPHLCALHKVRESLEDLVKAIRAALDVQPSGYWVETARDGLVETLRSAGSDADGVSDDYGQSADAMEDYFVGSSQVNEIREKAKQCRTWAQELEQAANHVEEADGFDVAKMLVTDAVGALEL